VGSGTGKGSDGAVVGRCSRAGRHVCLRFAKVIERRLSGLAAALSAGLLASGLVVVSVGPAHADTSFTAPDYPSAACTPVVSGLNLGLAPQQWNAIAGLPLTPTGTPSAQRIVIGEFDETANVDAVNLLLDQCGLDSISLTTHTNSSGYAGTNVGGLESTLDVTVAAAALPDNASITIVNTPSSGQGGGWYGLFVNMAEACGLEFNGDPWTGLRTLSQGSSYPAGGCIMSLSYGGAEGLQGDTADADFVLDQLAANGVIVAVSAGDEGSGGCISTSGTNFGDATLVGVTKAAVTSNVATITTESTHGFSAGASVYLGAFNPTLDGMYTVRSSPAPTDTTFAVDVSFPDTPETSVNAVASVSFGGLEPQYPATNPQVLAVGGTQWATQADTRTSGLGINYVPGATLSVNTWWDSSPNSNCANLTTFPTSGGEATGGGQSGKYAMPSYQQAAATANYPSAPAARMMPDVAALAGWPTYALANPGVSIKGLERDSGVATLYLGTVHGFEVGEEISVSLLPDSPTDYSSFEVVDAVVTAVTDKTISYNNAGGDVAPVYVASGTLSESCSAPCSASDFPWYPVVGTSAATPLTAIGIANVNAVLSARGLPIVNNGGGSTDIHSVVYSSTYASALTDVTSGSNDIHSLGGYSALTGYDMVTGMGTLNFSTLASRLIAVLTPSDAGGGGGSTVPPTTPAQPGDPIVNPPAVVAPDPIQEIVVQPVVTSPGRGVLVATGPNTVNTKRFIVQDKTTRKVRKAPKVRFPVKRWRVPILRVGGLARDFTAEIRIGKRWRVLGGVTSNARGKVALPALRFTKTRNYRIRLTDDAGKRSFVVLRARTR